jgi:glycine betaine/proline transport system substrate-binding protein
MSPSRRRGVRAVKRSPLSTLVAIATALAFLATGCGSAVQTALPQTKGGSGSDAAAAARADPSAIRIAVNPWTGSAVNANVAKIILERELGYRVQLIRINEYAQFPALATGDLDATLEVWPSGHAVDILRYITGRRGGPLRDGGVVNGGKLGVVGDIGWWIPTYMLNEHPDLATWQGINAHADLFRTPQSGTKGQLLDSDPSFVSYDGQIVKNLGLNLKVVNSGSERATLAALSAAFRRNAPLLLYFWTPHWAQQKYALTQVKLPPFDKACAAAARTKSAAGYDCGYPRDVLFKAFSLKLESKAPSAFSFLSKFHYTNAEQEQIAFQVDARGVPIARAARQWVDRHRNVWRAWLPPGAR